MLAGNKSKEKHWSGDKSRKIILKTEMFINLIECCNLNWFHVDWEKNYWKFYKLQKIKTIPCYKFYYPVSRV